MLKPAKPLLSFCGLAKSTSLIVNNGTINIINIINTINIINIINIRLLKRDYDNYTKSELWFGDVDFYCEVLNTYIILSKHH